MDFGKVIFLLMDGDDPICYYIDNVTNFMAIETAKYHWVSFLPDRCVNKVKDANEAGMFSFKLSIWDVSKKG